MAVSGKTAAPYELPYYLGADKPPDMAAVTKALAERAHTLFEASKLKVYTPKAIETEQTRENTEFGFLTTEDKVEGVVVPENGLLLVTYRANIKSSVAGAGRVALFVGATEAAAPHGEGMQALTEGTEFKTLNTDPSTNTQFNLRTGNTVKTTGQSAGAAVELFLAAGTYTVGMKYKATSGSVTAKNRKLWVKVLG